MIRAAPYARYSSDLQRGSVDRGPVPDLPRPRGTAGWTVTNAGQRKIPTDLHSQRPGGGDLLLEDS